METGLLSHAGNPGSPYFIASPTGNAIKAALRRLHEIHPALFPDRPPYAASFQMLSFRIAADKNPAFLSAMKRQLNKEDRIRIADSKQRNNIRTIQKR